MALTLLYAPSDHEVWPAGSDNKLHNGPSSAGQMPGAFFCAP